MLALFDTHYPDMHAAQTACVLASSWTSPEPYRDYRDLSRVTEKYVPGQFFLRELPCILQLYAKVREPIDEIVIDGFVWLAKGKAGLGAHLHDRLDQNVPVIGISKNPFRGDDISIAVYRGKSDRPLYITAVGTDPAEAASRVKAMDGDYRIPTLVRTTDKVSRDN